MYKIVIFDLDGTLVDSITDLANATNEGLKLAGLPTHSVEAYKKFVGNGREKLVERAMGDSYSDKKLSELVRDTFDTYYAEHCNDNIYAYDGCEQMLSKLSERGIKTAVLSNKPDEFVEKILKKTYPDHKFTLAWGKKADFPTKPDPKALLEILRELDIPQTECLYIGDSDVDVITAKNAEVDMIGVEWGFRGRYELINCGAPFVAETADDILEYIC